MTDLIVNKSKILNDNVYDIKDVLLKKEELLSHGILLAQNHRIESKMRSTKVLIKRMDKNYDDIFVIYKYLNILANAGGDLSPASEWLLDNFYKIEEQVKDVKQSLSTDRFVKLPTLANSYLKGYPRAYAIALELVSHTDGRVEEETLIDFAKVYQNNQILSIAEIWSLSLMIRIALIENIRIICGNIYNTQIQWSLAEETLKLKKEDIFKDIDDNVDEGLDISYIEHILAKVRREGLDLPDIVDYIEVKLDEHNTTINDIIQNEHKRHAIRRISIGNSITSLHSISTLNWNDIFESISVVEEKLRNDPIKVYSEMDFESRDYYRKAVEKIGKQWKISEVKIANQAVNLSIEAFKKGDSWKKSHVGYYLIDKGRDKLFELLKIGKDNHRLESTRLYISAVLISTTLLTLLYTSILSVNLKDLHTLLFVPLLFVSLSEITVYFVNYLFMKVYPVTLLPGLDLKAGIPKKAFTMVIIPALLVDGKNVKDLIEKMEVYYLANKDDNLLFALVGDFADSNKEEEENDKKIVSTALRRIKKLNETYSKDKEIFYYFHRKRIFNEKQNKWMGWERKRGAIIELNNLLKGKDNTFYIKSGYSDCLKELKYVITIDSDTNLKMNSAKKLIGIMLHPLNKAIFNEEKKVIVEGYGIIQPRIGINIEDANKTLFTRIFAYSKGIDPYTTAVSDIYQDVFGEGIFTGKGIYNLDYFNLVMKGKIEENTILSHDLLEGSLMRTGLATDIELIDGYPTKYKSYIMRTHRWVRGDWQLIKWLFKGDYLNSLSKLKIVDNLRRSLIAPSLFHTILIGSVLLKINILALIAVASSVFFFPVLLALIDTICSKRRFITELLMITKQGLWQLLIQIVFLPYNAYVMADAIIRTLYRVFISKKGLLEWVTAAEAEKKSVEGKTDYFKRMKSAYVLTALLFILLLIFDRANIPYSMPIAVIWLASPLIAYKISEVVDTKDYHLSKHDLRDLKRITRKTWAYFEDLVKEEYNYLPPDNYQEYPFRGIAARSSPTNIGLYLVSILSARDFGYITTSKLVEKVERTLKTIVKMESWKGHLFNWYDIKTLEVLRPSYVSTVDSGNFITYLLLLRQGLKEYLNKPIMDNNIMSGLSDTYTIYNKDTEGLDRILNRTDLGKMPQVVYLINVMEEINKSKNHFEGMEKVLKLIDMTETDFGKYYLSGDMINDINRVYLEKDENNGLAAYMEELLTNPPIKKLKEIYGSIADIVSSAIDKTGDESNRQNLIAIKENILEASLNLKLLIESAEKLIRDIDSIIQNTEFSPLYDEKRNLFSIGYDVEKEKITNSYYDLLASEARIASYWAIVNGNVPLKHWYRLGRALTKIDGSRALVSWTGTMFEYFMPGLILKNYSDTLINETYDTVIKSQKYHGERMSTPWGVSESGFFSFDFNLNYQYKAFGIPDLGLKRGLIEDIVISPYSTLLVLKDDPESSVENIKKLLHLGMEGKYGFYESLDFTPKRLRKDMKKEIVKSFMAHHLGMSMLALSNFLDDDVMVKRFHSHPLIKAGEFLLQEKVPVKSIITKEYKEWLEEKDGLNKDYVEPVRTYEEPNFLPPPCHLLSNGVYSLMINTKGEGYSKCNETFINRWRNDYLRNSYGNFVFIKNMSTGKSWSTTHKILDNEPDGYKVTFLPSRAEYIRRDEEINSITEVFISPEDNVEIRRLKIENHSTEDATFEITSFFELSLNNLHNDLAHRAFYNLFIRTEFLEEHESIIAVRRPREKKENEMLAFHTAICEGDTVGQTQFETSRQNFIGRGRNIRSFALMDQPLTNTAGIVLDPCMSLRKRIKVEAGKSGVLSFVIGYGDSRAQIMDLCSKYKELSAIQRAYELSITRSQVESAYLSLTAKEILSYDNMISHIIYKSPTKRQFENMIIKNNKNQSSLWAYGISGDLPIVLLSVKQEQDIPMVRQGLKAHEYLGIKGLKADLVILNEDESNYLQPLRTMINDIVEKSSGRHLMGREGGIFIKNVSNMPYEDILLLYAASAIALRGGEGPFHKQLKNIKWDCNNKKMPMDEVNIIEQGNVKDEGLLYFNGYGGFDLSGDEYVINNTNTPAPWINVISNSNFGFIVSESGGGYVWAENSRENRLTPWSNDPVMDDINEVVYFKDLKTDDLWTVTDKPMLKKSPSTVKHGWGYTVFEKDYNEIEHEMTVFVPVTDSIKATLIKLRNKSHIKKEIKVTYYMDPVLGVHEYFTKQHIITEFDYENSLFLFKNSYNNDFPHRKVFMFTTEKISSFTGDKCKFFGSLGRKDYPWGLLANELDGDVGVGYESCGAIQIGVDIEPGEEKELAFYIGQVTNNEMLENYIKRYYRLNYAKTQLNKVKDQWKEITDIIKIKTPDPSMDLMLNGWMVYQTLSCRIWGRSAFYQSGGAYGFRDQLQDAMNIGLISSQIFKNQILIHARHQFKEGDVQHWWHPADRSKGVRTKFSDDLLWLPFAVIEYIDITGDYSILKLEETFLEDRLLKEDEDERYGVTDSSDEKGTIYEHCNKALDKSLKYGEHQLPLMGSGDWNDGMNRVGNKGKGESVWLAFFLYSILVRYTSLCDMMNDKERSHRYKDEADRLNQAIDEYGWDGNWYRRAYYDDGTPLGSAENSECTIDSIAQSWAVLSGAGSKDKCEMAMESLKRHLVKEDIGIILLFAPPFDKGEKDPGYIKSYVPGVRENGGQYTHAASWVISAFASLGHGDTAWKLFNMINPINHTRTLKECSIYKTEPYVLAADVYSVNPHAGRGGWSWYTGAAGWFFKAGLEYILGFKKRNDMIFINPCIPSYWEGFQIFYRYNETRYSIRVENPDKVSTGVKVVTMDGVIIKTEGIKLVDDGNEHEITIIMGEKSESLP